MWRSLLFIPTLSEAFLAKAHQRGADGIILDLEDSIPPTRKQDARQCLADAVNRLRQHPIDVLVRINAPWRLAVRDLEAAVMLGVSAIIAPKVAGPDHVEALAETLAELEAERGITDRIGLIGLLETPRAVLHAEAIAKSTRMRGLVLGGEDFALAMGAPPTVDLLKQPCQHVALAAKAAGCAALGYPGSIAEFQDLAAFRGYAGMGAALGLRRRICDSSRAGRNFKRGFYPELRGNRIRAPLCCGV